MRQLLNPNCGHVLVDGKGWLARRNGSIAQLSRGFAARLRIPVKMFLLLPVRSLTEWLCHCRYGRCAVAYEEPFHWGPRYLTPDLAFASPGVGTHAIGHFPSGPIRSWKEGLSLWIPGCGIIVFADRSHLFSPLNVYHHVEITLWGNEPLLRMPESSAQWHVKRDEFSLAAAIKDKL